MISGHVCSSATRHALARGNKNDRNDAVAIYEAAVRLNMRFVSVKLQLYLILQVLHCLRDWHVTNRKTAVNQESVVTRERISGRKEIRNTDLRLLNGPLRTLEAKAANSDLRFRLGLRPVSAVRGQDSSMQSQ